MYVVVHKREIREVNRCRTVSRCVQRVCIRSRGFANCQEANVTWLRHAKLTRALKLMYYYTLSARTRWCYRSIKISLIKISFCIAFTTNNIITDGWLHCGRLNLIPMMKYWWNYQLYSLQTIYNFPIFSFDAKKFWNPCFILILADDFQILSFRTSVVV